MTKTKLSIERLALCGVDRVAKRRTNNSNIFLRMRFALVSLSSSPFSIGCLICRESGSAKVISNCRAVWNVYGFGVMQRYHARLTARPPFLNGLFNCVVYCHLLFSQSHSGKYSAPPPHPRGDLSIAPFTAPLSVCHPQHWHIEAPLLCFLWEMWRNHHVFLLLVLFRILNSCHCRLQCEILI